MNHYKSEKPGTKLELGFIVIAVLVALALGAAGVGFVFIKNQQHALGMQVRELEREIRELQATHQVLVSDVTRLTSHARLADSVSEGALALVAISDQFVARLTPPTIVSGSGEFRAASAASAGEVRR